MGNREPRAHKKLDVWKESIALATMIYQITEKFPNDERFGLTSQMRRAVVSIPSNIAEGAARVSAREFAQFLKVAGGSLSELDTQVEIAINLTYISAEIKQDVDSRINSISRKLAGLIKMMKKKIGE